MFGGGGGRGWLLLPASVLLPRSRVDGGWASAGDGLAPGAVDGAEGADDLADRGGRLHRLDTGSQHVPAPAGPPRGRLGVGGLRELLLEPAGLDAGERSAASGDLVQERGDPLVELVGERLARVAPAGRLTPVRR